LVRVNTEGGKIIVGVNDDGSIAGLTEEENLSAEKQG